MAEEADYEAFLRQEFHSQTAKIRWHELQTYYAHGNVIRIAPGLNLVEVAVQLGLDNTSQFQAWIADQQIIAVHDEQALAWYEADVTLWAVVAPPWVLVQEISEN
ncbi:DUF2288 domain-containing protein [Haliea sp. E17]|uniref:DUF2288 domain-containing protein n=1 Tax=Haliea sp. E17 TaxID=3401576 RepID=UPI003AAEE1B3